MCISRRRLERAFDEQDQDQLSQIRCCAEQPVARIAQYRSGWYGNDVILQALRAALPVPCAVFDHLGRPVWLNDAAVRQFQIPQVPSGTSMISCVTRKRIRAWSDAILEADANQGPMDPKAIDGATVRRIERPNAEPVYLVVQSSGPLPRGLTSREQQVVELAANGYSALNVARQLGLAEGTVRNHLKKIYRKLHVGSRVELARKVWGR